MALADDLLSVVDQIRGIPGSLGLRPNRVYLVKGTWSGTYSGEQSLTEDAEELLVGGQPPKVRVVNDEQRALGNLPDGTIEVGPLTPAFGSGGVEADALFGKTLDRSEDLHLKVVGPAGTSYFRITEVKTDRRLRYMVRAEPVKVGA